MAETAAHLVDHVLPVVPIRQWVLSLPYSLRTTLGYEPALLGARTTTRRVVRSRHATVESTA